MNSVTFQLDWWLLNYEAQLTSGSRQLLLSEKHNISYVEGSDGAIALLFFLLYNFVLLSFHSEYTWITLNNISINSLESKLNIKNT